MTHEIIKDGEGIQHGTDGTLTVSLFDPAGRMFKRRGMRGLMRSLPGDKVLPLLNGLAGELHNQLDMDGETLRLRLLALADLCVQPKPEQVDWLVAELDGVRLYQHGNHIVMTKQDMYP